MSDERAEKVGFLLTADPTRVVGMALAEVQVDRQASKGSRKALKLLAKRLKEGDPSHLEELLLLQTELLHGLFVQNIRRCSASSTVDELKAYSEIAMKAQNQSRRTIAALADLKSPKRTTFIKQQNNAVNQQVNNSEKKSENELMEAEYGERLDGETEKETVGVNSSVEALGEVHRAKI